MKEKLIGNREKPTVIVEDFNNLPWIMDRNKNNLSGYNWLQQYNQPTWPA